MCERPITSLGELWTIYHRKVTDQLQGELDMEMSKRSFYAGAGSTLSAIIRACGVSNDFGSQVMDGFLDECVEYLQELSKNVEKETSV